MEWSNHAAKGIHHSYEIRAIDPKRAYPSYNLYVDNQKLPQIYSDTASPKAFASLIEEKQIPLQEVLC